MDVPAEAIQAIAQVNTKRQLRWRPLPQTPFCMGFGVGQAPPTLRFTRLTADTKVTRTYVDDATRGVTWNMVEVTGFAYLKWTEPTTYLHLEFAGGAGGDGDRDEMGRTISWLKHWELRWQALLDTKLPYPTIKAVVQAASTRYAMDAIQLATTLLEQLGNDPAALKLKVGELWAMRQQPSRIRAELKDHRLPANDRDLISVIGGAKAVASRMG